MSSDTPISDLIINKLSYNQYKEVISENTYNNEQIYEIKDISHTFNTHAGILSNCILEIPQNIKLTLENNVLTLKAGSTVALTRYNTYTTRTTDSDIIKDSWASQWYNKRVFIFIGATGTWFGFKDISLTGSGSSLPSDGSIYTTFYLTTDNTLYMWSNNTWSASTYSYPLCVVDVDSNGVASFAKDSAGHDMIFNGAGFIGHHVFVYPGIKGLAPNELNEDGSLKSNIYNRTSLTIVEMNTRENSFDIANNTAVYRHTFGEDYHSIEELENNGIYHYIKNDNIYARILNNVLTKSSVIPFIKFVYNGTTVTDFTIQQPFRADESKKFTYRQW